STSASHSSTASTHSAPPRSSASPKFGGERGSQATRGSSATMPHLYQNGLIFKLPEKALEDMTVSIANKDLSKFMRYKDLKKKYADPEVAFLAHWLKKNTRKIDHQ
ncbi:hypothetical protein, partial [Leisingera sp. F5]|uniref:hypothetical protein n=1 Tax=Leisingera sp. F5 TaxID=1813816 RepID=UPI0025BCDEE8